MRPLLKTDGTSQNVSSVCFPVSVGRQEQRKCFQLATKSSGRPQQLQFCRQPVPCSWCGDREKPCRRFVDVSAARRGRRTTRHAVRIERVHRQLMSVKSEMYTPRRVSKKRLVDYMDLGLVDQSKSLAVLKRSDFWQAGRKQRHF